MENIQNYGGKLEKLRENGISFRLSDSEIDQCLIQCLKKSTAENDKQQNVVYNAKGSGWRRVFSRCLCIVLFLLIFLTIAAIIFYILLQDDEFSAKFLKAANQYIYPVMRALRLTFLPLVKSVNLAVYHDDLCLIDNPYYIDVELDCETCQKIGSAVVNELNSDTFDKNYQAQMKSVKVMKSHTVITFEDIRKLYLENKFLMNGGIHIISSSNNSYSDLSYFMENFSTQEALQDEHFSFKWKSRRVGPSRFFTKLFPKPSFVSSKTEIFMERNLFIDGLQSESQILPPDTFLNGWYVQASGCRTVWFHPQVGCEHKCDSFKTIMTAGDVLYLPRTPWRIEMAPVEEEDRTEEIIKMSQEQISIGYVAPF